MSFNRTGTPMLQDVDEADEMEVGMKVEGGMQGLATWYTVVRAWVTPRRPD